jgi:hypothetical protein
MQQFTLASFGWRLLFAAALVFLTFNPSGYSYYHWVRAVLPSVNPYIALAGLVLLIGWVIYVRATLRSLGRFGIHLVVGVCACIVWLFYYWGWLTKEDNNVLPWIFLVFQSFLFAVGMSWSHIHRRLTGQVDTDDVDSRH